MELSEGFVLPTHKIERLRNSLYQVEQWTMVWNLIAAAKRLSSKAEKGRRTTKILLYVDHSNALDYENSEQADTSQ